MIEVKEVVNTINKEEFISKKYLLEIARDIINEDARAISGFNDDRFYLMYSRIDGILDAFM